MFNIKAEVLRLQGEIDQIVAQDYTSYYLDEVLFSSKATFDRAWSPLRDNFQIDKK